MDHYPSTLFIFLVLAFSLELRFCRAENCKGTKVASVITVNKFGHGSFSTIQAAINSVPSQNDKWIKIDISPGEYNEQVTIPSDKPCIFLKGGDMANLSCLDFTINATYGVPSAANSVTYITAQGRPSSTDRGGCLFKRGIVYGSGQVFLGRAYGPFSRVIFHKTALPSAVVPRGWDAWQYTGHEENIVFAEVNCMGTGSDIRKRVSWEKKLNPQDRNQFSKFVFIGGDRWLSKLPSNQ